VKRLLTLFGLCLAAQAGAEDLALRTLDECRARLDSHTDIGIERVQRRCPDLLPALEKAPWRGLLPKTLGQRREEISAESLRTLAYLVRRAALEAEQRKPPVQEALGPVLAELGEHGKQGVTRWERFKRWLQQRLEKRRDDGPDLLDQLARQLRTSEGVAQLITYLGYVLVILLVLFVIWSELRALGLLGGTRRADRGGKAAAEWRRRLMLTDVFAAPLVERPGMLLKLLGEALSRAHRLPAPEGLTAAELARRARLESDGDRAGLERVAAAAERVRYAPTPPDDAAIEGAVDEARELLGRVAKLSPGRQ